MDLAPTIFDLANIEIPGDLDGNSFKQKLFNKTDDEENGIILIEYFGEGNRKTVDPNCPWIYSSDVSVREFLK